ncbi:MAG: hypothetical protein ACRDZ2_13855 [Ilumatobacteraceae bacterium]
MQRRALIGLVILATGCAGAVAAPAVNEPTTTTTVMTPTTTVAPPVVAALRELRVADDNGRIVEVDGGEVHGPRPGILGMDGHTEVGTKGTQVFWIPDDGPSYGARVEGPVGNQIMDGELVPLVTDTAGEWVALGPPAGEAAHGTIAAGRSTTELAVVHPGGDVVTVELNGNFVPEAFSLESHNGQAAPQLYVLEYRPAEAPTHYRVRVLDPNTGELAWPISLRRYGETVETEMAGISRDQVVAGGRALLFTLYRGTHGETDRAYAFIHVLSMWGGVWCLEVPALLDLANTQGVVAVSPDESTLYAVSANGLVAEYRIDDVIDPGRSPVAARVVRTSAGWEDPPVAVVTDQHLIVGQGRGVTWFERDQLGASGQAASFGAVEALATTEGGDLIVAAAGHLGLAVPGAPIEPLVELPAAAGSVVRIAPK